MNEELETKKKCSKCKKEKFLSEFFNNKRTKDGKNCYCKICHKSTTNFKKYRENNLQKEKERYKEYRKDNLEKLREYDKNRNSQRERKNYQNEWRKNKNKTDSKFSFSLRIKSRLKSVFHENKIPKKSKTFDLLGYSPEKLNYHLSKWLDKPCEICGSTVLKLSNCHIDHIIPISSAETKDQIIELNKLKNLRLLCPFCNLEKGAKNGE